MTRFGLRGKAVRASRPGCGSASEPIVHAEFDGFDVLLGADKKGRIAGQRDISLKLHVLISKIIVVGFGDFAAVLQKP